MMFDYFEQGLIQEVLILARQSMAIPGLMAKSHSFSSSELWEGRNSGIGVKEYSISLWFKKEDCGKLGNVYHYYYHTERITINKEDDWIGSVTYDI